MSLGKIVVAVQVLDNADILRDYLEWHLSLDVDLILAHDFCSSDGSQDILEEFARQGAVKWWPHPHKSTENYDPTAQLARRARDEYGADWVLHFDTDEFLCAEGDSLRTILERAAGEDLTVVPIRGFNMTGAALVPGQDALRTLTLRIVHGILATPEEQIAGNPHFPIVFLHWPSKSIVRAAAFSHWSPGNHRAESAWGKTGEAPQLRFLHYPFRSMEAFELKVQHAREWLEANPHLAAKPRWGWHWRRWVRMDLRQLGEEFDRQFVSPERAAALLADGTCVVDETVMRRLLNLDSGSGEAGSIRAASDPPGA